MCYQRSGAGGGVACTERSRPAVSTQPLCFPTWQLPQVDLDICRRNGPHQIALRNHSHKLFVHSDE